MANGRLSMRKIKEVLRPTHDGELSDRQVVQSLNISRSTVKDYRARAQRAGLGWPLPETLSEEALEQKLFPLPVLSSRRPKRCRILSTSHGSLKPTGSLISPWICCGRSTKNNIPRATSTRNSASRGSHVSDGEPPNLDSIRAFLRLREIVRRL